MTAEPLCIRTFGEIIRSRMSKKIRKKEYLPDKKTFESDSDVASRAEIKGSGVANFYSGILMEAIIYYPRENGEELLPDITSTMCTKLKLGRDEVHGNIVKLAQQKGAITLASNYFLANLIPNIPKPTLSIVLDAVDSLIQGDSALGKTKQKELHKKKTEKTPADYLAEVLIIAVCNGKNVIVQTEQPSERETINDVVDAMKKIEELLEKLPAPPPVTVPQKKEKHELKYIAELFSAYGDAENIEDFNDDSLAAFPTYIEDLDDRRIDYFSADSIRRGVEELLGDQLKGQFEVLKLETHSGVKDTARRTFSNGYERMLAVMQQATVVPINGYLLSRSHNWISSNIRRGICHFLVAEDKLKWVK